LRDELGAFLLPFFSPFFMFFAMTFCGISGDSGVQSFCFFAEKEKFASGDLPFFGKIQSPW
jgi:hypothetical protein